MPYESVPIIDIAPFNSGDPAAKRAVAAEMRRACEEIGFFTIVGHGVSEALIEDTRQLALEFFRRPMASKRQIERPPSKISRGYSWVGDRGLSYSLGDKAPPDLQESFAMGPIAPAPAAVAGTPAEQAFFFPNMWPGGEPRFRSTFENCYRELEKVATQVMRIFAVALDLDEHHFDDKVDQHTSTMRAILYPALAEAPSPGQLRSGAHTDYGTVTILRGDDVPGGLQVRLLDGSWVDVHPLPGSFVCNIGDLMMRWTNDRWLSNLHRVVIPPAEFAHLQRLTLVFFHNPNCDAEIRCIDQSAPAKYQPVRFGDYYLRKHMKAQHLTTNDDAERLAEKMASTAPNDRSAQGAP
jgi:isopenicillin N synthase-like dioxygenase